MTISPLLLYIWGALFVCFTALLVYRGTLTRYEDDQLFLDDDAITVQRNRERHEELIRKITRIKPLLNTCAVAAGLVTTTVIGLYVYQAWQNVP